MRLMWNVPVLPVMEYDALPRVCIVLYDGVRLVGRYALPTAVSESCVDVCQRMPGTHTYARQSRAINAYRETGSPMPRRPTRAARVLTESFLAMSVRCTAVRRDLDTSVKSSLLSGDLSAANACLPLAPAPGATDKFATIPWPLLPRPDLGCPQAHMD